MGKITKRKQTEESQQDTSLLTLWHSLYALNDTTLAAWPRCDGYGPGGQCRLLGAVGMGGWWCGWHGACQLHGYHGQDYEDFALWVADRRERGERRQTKSPSYRRTIWEARPAADLWRLVGGERADTPLPRVAPEPRLPYKEAEE